MKKKFLQQKRQEACRWLSANKGDEYWFEARAYIKINGTEVFTCRADLSGKEVIDIQWEDNKTLKVNFNNVKENEYYTRLKVEIFNGIKIEYNY